MQRRNRRGSNIIEFTLLLPVFWLFIAGSIDITWYLTHQAALDDAVNRGCRAGALVDPGDREIYLDGVQIGAQAAFQEAMLRSPAGGCEGDCTFSVGLFGDPPLRSIRCDATQTFQPILGIVMSEQTKRAGTVAMMEWQRWP